LAFLWLSSWKMFVPDQYSVIGWRLSAYYNVSLSGNTYQETRQKLNSLVRCMCSGRRGYKPWLAIGSFLFALGQPQTHTRKSNRAGEQSRRCLRLKAVKGEMRLVLA